MKTTPKLTACLILVTVASFAGCSSTPRVASVPGFGWLASNEDPVLQRTDPSSSYPPPSASEVPSPITPNVQIPATEAGFNPGVIASTGYAVGQSAPAVASLPTTNSPNPLASFPSPPPPGRTPTSQDMVRQLPTYPALPTTTPQPAASQGSGSIYGSNQTQQGAYATNSSPAQIPMPPPSQPTPQTSFPPVNANIYDSASTEPQEYANASTPAYNPGGNPPIVGVSQNTPPQTLPAISESPQYVDTTTETNVTYNAPMPPNNPALNQYGTTPPTETIAPPNSYGENQSTYTSGVNQPNPTVPGIFNPGTTQPVTTPPVTPPQPVATAIPAAPKTSSVYETPNAQSTAWRPGSTTDYTR